MVNPALYGRWDCLFAGEHIDVRSDVREVSLLIGVADGADQERAKQCPLCGLSEPVRRRAV